MCGGEGAGGRGFNPGEWGVEFAGVRAGQVEDVDVGVLGCDAAGDDVALGDDSFGAAGNVEEGGAGGVASCCRVSVTAASMLAVCSASWSRRIA